jgi:YVTN family beta-propeller protein
MRVVRVPTTTPSGTPARLVERRGGSPPTPKGEITMEDRSTSGAPARPSRRGFLAASAGAVALAAAACSTSSGSTPAPAPPADGFMPDKDGNVGPDFDLVNAGGRLGWAGVAVIGGGQSNKIFIMDARSHKIVTTVYNEGAFAERTDPSKYPNLRDSHAILFTKDFKRMFSASAFNYDVSTIIEYDPVTMREVARVEAGTGSHHIALTPDDKYIYVANQYGANLSVIDTASMTKVADLPVGEGPDYISPSMYWDGKAIDTKYMYVTVDGAKTLAVIDWRTNSIAKQIPMPATAHGVNLTPDGKFVWLAGLAFKEVWVIDNSTLEIISKLPIPSSPIHISISPDSKFAYITTADNVIYKVDTQTYQTLWQSKGTVIPAHTGLSPDGKELWTLNHGMDTTRYPFLLGGQPIEGVQIWNTDNGALTHEIPMEAMPHEIQFVPYSAFGTPKPKQDVGTGGT